MNGKKKLAVFALLFVLLAAVAVGLVWHMNHYVMVDFRFYSRDTQVLDLRGEAVSISRYEKLHRQLPGCRILWNVPFQQEQYPNDTRELTVTVLSEEDVTRLAYFPELQTLDARQCGDYAQLMKVMKLYPQLQLNYQIPINGQLYAQDTQTLQLDNISGEDLALLPVLPQLQAVALTGMEDRGAAVALREYCRENGITFCVVLGEENYSEEVTQITVKQITDEQLQLLELLPGLSKIHMVEPAASAQNLMALRQSRSDLTVTWEKDICGLTCTDSTVDVDLSQMQIPSVEAVEQGLEYLPNVKSVFLGLCGLDNEEIAAYRERSREKYKVVWTVDLSGKMQVRTDITNFMPSRDGWGYVRDHEIDNIRYCEDLICIDIGHMGVKDVSFLETLVNLEYLILAHTEVQYVDAIVNCKKLKYLELDWSCIRDVSPLVELTALEDLNLGMTWPDITPILQMTWLKNLYIIKGNTRANFAEALPNTRVVATGEYTVSNGWRNLPNYYAMRDILGMYYM